MTAVALIPGPAGHGVVRHGRALAEAAHLPVVRTAREVPDGAAVLVEITDRVLGPTVAAATVAATDLLTALRARRCRVVVALHDVPGADDWSEGRKALYRTVIGASDGVVVCSRTEADRARGWGARRVVVAPIPVADRRPGAVVCAGPATSVTVAGFVWPGKGHAEVLAAMDVLPADTPLVVAGAAADGHDDVLGALRGRPVVVSGHVPDDAFGALLTAATVPVAPNRAVTASATIAAWWGAGRRVLAPAVPYVLELAERCPEALTVYDDLRPALRAAWADPGSTWLAADVRPGPLLAEVARIRLDALTAWT